MISNEYKNESYQRKVDVGMLNTVKIYWASYMELDKSSRCLIYPHQLSVDAINCFTRFTDADQH